jgi:hypothetical protein
MKRLSSAVALLLLVAPVFAAADVTGKWSGSFQVTRPNGTLSDDKIVMNLAQKDTEVTGTVGPTADLQRPIRNGKFTGDNLAFEMTTPDDAVMSFALTLADGHLKGDASAEYAGVKIKGVIDATRGK